VEVTANVQTDTSSRVRRLEREVAELREELALRAAVLAERFAPSINWRALGRLPRPPAAPRARRRPAACSSLLAARCLLRAAARCSAAALAAALPLHRGFPLFFSNPQTLKTPKP